jgi:MoxR-like ATPase
MPPAREAPNDEALNAEASKDVIAAFDRASQALGRARQALRGVIFGQDTAVELALAAVVGGGHALVTGAPGVSKTRLVEALGRTLGLHTGRLPLATEVTLEDLIGAGDDVRRETGEAGRRRSRAGPIFRHLLLLENLAAAPPRVRALLIEALQDGGLTHGGRTWPLPRPFHVLATGDTDVAAGLSQAEADRFLLQIDMGWPDRSGERRLLLETGDEAPLDLRPVLDVQTLLEAQRTAVALPVGEAVVQTILELVRRARPDDPSAPTMVREAVARGPGPRAGQALMRLTRARALLDGRPAPSQADVRALALAVLKPRLSLQALCRRGPTAEEVVNAVLASL